MVQTQSVFSFLYQMVKELVENIEKKVEAQPCKLISYTYCATAAQLGSFACTQQIIMVVLCLANGLAGLIMSERNCGGGGRGP